jgi:hypothetical protein
MPELYSYKIKDFAAALNLSERTVKRLVSDGKVKSVLVTPKARRLEAPEDFQARQLDRSADPLDRRPERRAVKNLLESVFGGEAKC